MFWHIWLWPRHTHLSEVSEELAVSLLGWEIGLAGFVTDKKHKEGLYVQELTPDFFCHSKVISKFIDSISVLCHVSL